MTDRLDRYRARRDFDRTSEPTARTAPVVCGPRRFVVQHHDASREHYDFRLEHAGVLLSWAVPKGPSTDPGDKRLAIRTEDHPVDYLEFEGTIPAGEYGGGAVIVWDIGTWEPIGTGTVDAGLEAGHLSFRVAGHKLQGGFTLQRFGAEGDQWLLIKRRDEDADAGRDPVATEPRSVLSGRTVGQVAAEDGVTDGEDAP